MRKLLAPRTVALPTAEPVTEPGAAPATSPSSTSPSAPASPAPAAAPAREPAATAPYAWRRNWVPVSPVAQLDATRPTPVTLLGESLVVWQRAKAGDAPAQWVVMRDACPHRLAPLSEGRLEGGGSRLACAYHGWEFSEAGACSRIPQLAADGKAAATATASPRACVTSYPVAVADGVLFAWLDASREGLAAAAAAPRPQLMPEGVIAPMDWFMNELPNDYKFWVEQGMDPAHANFLHHGLFNQYDAVPMEGERVKEIDLAKGWRWEHRGYEKKNKDMRGLREFLPPFTIRVEYVQPSGAVFHVVTLQVPVRPGVCRTYFKSGFSRRKPGQGQEQQQQQQQQQQAASAVGAQGQAAAEAEAEAAVEPAAAKAATVAGAKAGDGGSGKPTEPSNIGSLLRPGGGLFTLLRAVPHWVVSSQLIADQDTVMMCRQELLMRRQGLDRRAYNLNSRSDEGVSAINRWLDMAGYPDSLWGAIGAAAASAAAAPKAAAPPPPAGQTYPGWPEQELPLEMILSRQERHVRHCAVCQRGLKLVTRVCVVLTAAAALAVLAAGGLAVVAATGPAGLAAVGGWRALAGAAAAAAALAAAALAAWGLREERFVSGVANWNRIGGFAVLHKKMKRI